MPEVRSNFLYVFFHFASELTLVPNLAGTFSMWKCLYVLPNTIILLKSLAEVSFIIINCEKLIAFAKSWRGSSCFSSLI